jgi:mycothiol synthase
MSSSPPDPFGTRSLRPEDAAGAAELVNAFDAAHLDEATDELSPADILDWWRLYDLDRDSIGAFAERLAAFGLVDERDEEALQLHAMVDPGYARRGLGSFLLDWAEAKSAPGRSLRTVIGATDDRARLLVGARGYRQVRQHYRMAVDLEEPPPSPDWPEGFAVAVLRAGEERRLYEVIEEAFADEWGRPPRSFEDWQRGTFGSQSFDPTLCFLTRAGDEVVAAEMCRHRFGMGFVGAIGVRRPWRRLGLGRALLLHAFGELYRRGERRIGLGVDAENATGATKLYESVGMRVAWQADTYEKAL